MPSSLVRQAEERLRAAGVSEDGIAALVATEADARKVLDYPEGMVRKAALQFPAPKSGYQQAISDFGFDAPAPVPFSSQLAESGYLDSGPGYTKGKDGAYKFNNGVIVAPGPDGTMSVIFDGGDAGQVGSHAWFQKVSNWSDAKVNQWRKTLNKFGYQVPTKGGYDEAFRQALFEFHYNRYLNFGKPLAKDAAGGGADAIAPDPVEVRNSVREQFQRVFGDNPSDDELEQWASFVEKTSLRLQRNKNYDPGYAATAAGERFVEKFEQDPEAQLFLEEQEDLEMSTKLRDSLISTARLIG